MIKLLVLLSLLVGCNDSEDMERFPVITEENIERALTWDKDTALRALKSEHFKEEHVLFVLLNAHRNFASIAVKSKYFSEKHMSVAMSSYPNVRYAAVRSKHFTSKYMKLALLDDDWNVRIAAVRSDVFGYPYMIMALVDDSVASTAIESPYFNINYIDYVDLCKNGFFRLVLRRVDDLSITIDDLLELRNKRNCHEVE